MSTTPENPSSAKATAGEPTIPAGSPVPTWLPSCPKYTPTEVEKDVVGDLQKAGAPQIVYYVDRGSAATAVASKGEREIWFVTDDWMHEYHGSAGAIVKNPEGTLVAMKSTGVLDLPF